MLKFNSSTKSDRKLPTTAFVNFQDNLKLAPVSLIGAMKIKTMFQRTVFRDYYDTFVIVKDGHLSLSNLIELAVIYNNKLTSQAITKRLTNYKNFREEKNFGLLSPKYDVGTEQIGEFFIGEVEKMAS